MSASQVNARPDTVVGSEPIVSTDEDLSDLAGTITLEDIKTKKHIGGGGFGVVYLLEHRTLGVLALKRLHDASNSDDETKQRRRARREGLIWRGLDHPNVLKFMGVVESEKDFFFVCPFQENGSLDNFIRKNPEVDRIQVIRECIAAVVYLHDKRIIHGDIKAANFLVSRDEHILICDFGLTRPEVTATSTDVQGAGSVRWMSPELLLASKGKTYASDVWAVGMTIYEILSGLLPYNEHSQVIHVIGAIAYKKLTPNQEPRNGPDGTSYEPIWKLVSGCWSMDPTKRPTMRRLHELYDASHSVVSKPSLKWASSVLNDIDEESSARTTIGRIFNLFRPPSYTRKRQDILFDTVFTFGGIRVIFGLPAPGAYPMFSPDSHSVVSVEEGDTVVLRSIEKGPKIRWSIKFEYRVSALRFSPDGSVLAVGCFNRVHLLDGASGGKKGILDQDRAVAMHDLEVVDVAFSPDARCIVCAYSGGAVRLWDTVSLICTRKLVFPPPRRPGTRPLPFYVHFSPDGKTLACYSLGEGLIFWDMETYAYRPREKSFYSIQSSSLCPDRSTIVKVPFCSSPQFFVQDIASTTSGRLPADQEVVKVVGYKTECLITLSPNGCLLAIGRWEELRSYIDVWDLTRSSIALLETLPQGGPKVRSISFSPNGAWLVVSTGIGMTVWDMDGILDKSSTMVYRILSNGWKQGRYIERVRSPFT